MILTFSLMLESSYMFNLSDTIRTPSGISEITTIQFNSLKFIITKNIKLNLYSCRIEPHDINKTIENRINIIFSNTNNLNMDTIIKVVLVCANPYKNPDIIYNEDKYNIFNINKDSNIKYKHNKSLLYNKFFNSTSNINFNKINVLNYKELLLNDKQFYKLILSEIDKINFNTKYAHYICCNNDDIMDLNIRFVYNTGELGKKMEIFNNKHGFNYFEINIKLSRMYPFIPPTIKYIKPKVEIELISNIYNMNLWDYKSWTYTITLDYIITNLGDILEPLFNKYMDIENNSFDYVELKMIELNSISKINNSTINQINIKIPESDSSNNKLTNSWKSGTGFGSGNKTESWDIFKFIDVNKTNNERIISILKEINTQDIKFNQMLYNYIEHKFIGLNLLTLNTEIDIYIEVISIIKKINNNDDSFIKTITNYIKDMKDELNSIITNEQISSCIEEKFMIVYLYFIEIINKALDDSKLTKDIQLNVGIEYENMFKENSFGEFELTNTNLFFNKQKEFIAPKTIMRIMSEISSLKKDIPINWDSSVAIRTCSTNANYLSFIISGPKDTPYHNGLFEFHAYFPDKYPFNIPSVLLKTTDNGRVRFNPNLYSNGKVCLSLLGTWSGEKGESWIPEISTFFQVILSIQSLILVDEPYFNEPGYERSMNTDMGKKNSFNYNDNIRLETIKVGMIKMLENPPESYETVVREHFRLKKDEIINIIEKWASESNNKEEFNNSIIKLKNLI